MKTPRPFRYLVLGLLALPCLFHSTPATAASFIGGTYTENFDIMGAGTITPANWSVGIGTAAGGTAVMVSDGSLAPSATAAGYNFGVTAAADRALGTAPVSGARNIEVQIRNDTGVPISSFNIAYDGEQWRLGTLAGPSLLVLRYSSTGLDFVDMGSAFNFTSPRTAVPPVFENMPLDGNTPLNRVAGIGGTYRPTTPVPDGGTIYLRWVDADENGGDPGLAVDNFSFSVAAVSGPPLTIQDNNNGTVTVSWAFPSTGYVLQSTPELPASSWSPVLDADVPAGGKHNVTVNKSITNQRYFRLNNPLATP